jgi:hypothetical protein
MPECSIRLATCGQSRIRRPAFVGEARVSGGTLEPRTQPDHVIEGGFSHASCLKSDQTASGPVKVVPAETAGTARPRVDGSKKIALGHAALRQSNKVSVGEERIGSLRAEPGMAENEVCENPDKTTFHARSPPQNRHSDCNRRGEFCEGGALVRKSLDTNRPANSGIPSIVRVCARRSWFHLRMACYYVAPRRGIGTLEVGLAAAGVAATSD